MQQLTLETDLATMREWLADPSLLASAVVVRVGETDGIVRYRLAVPVGGARRAGHLDLADYTEALAALAVLDGQPGFPHVRLRELVTLRGSRRRTIIWGEDPPTTGAVARWKFYGYSDMSIPRYMHRTPEGGRASDHPPETVRDTS
ncbi:DUF6302 family protein [Streptomyces sp. NPDC058603]|uniref:DUF6302 family protein n=1 Tax=Streptomyces sp. NPDC058603 TaxID=3346551 RepID=UPI003651979F